MSVIVTILNKRGVVVAADKAATTSFDDTMVKVTDNARKIFPIPGNSIAIAILGCSDFMGAPVDMLIDNFIASNKDERFKSLEECRECLLTFYGRQKELLKEENRQRCLDTEIIALYNHIMYDCNSKISISDRLLESTKMFKDYDRAHNLGDYSIKAFQNETREKILDYNNYYFKTQLSDDELSHFAEALYYYITSDFSFYETEIIFVGYGEKNIFPEIDVISISSVYRGNGRYRLERHETVSNETPYIILPFGQDGIIRTMLDGISPATRQSIDEEFEEMITDTRFSEVGQNADRLVAVFKRMVENQIYFSNIEFMASVSNYYIKDMSFMAQELVHLTYLFLHFAGGEEAVSNSIDSVAISKNSMVIDFS